MCSYTTSFFSDINHNTKQLISRLTTTCPPPSHLFPHRINKRRMVHPQRRPMNHSLQHPHQPRPNQKHQQQPNRHRNPLHHPCDHRRPPHRSSTIQRRHHCTRTRYKSIKRQPKPRQRIRPRLKKHLQHTRSTTHQASSSFPPVNCITNAINA